MSTLVRVTGARLALGRAQIYDFGAYAMIQLLLYSTGMAVLTPVDLGTLARVGTALADPTRRRVLVALIDGPGYPAEMAEAFGTTRANLSNHLTCLRECGLVTATAEGRRVRYELADQRLAEGLRILAALDLPGSCR
jgi:DNA-binding transcriptional ArsR family regulator